MAIRCSARLAPRAIVVSFASLVILALGASAVGAKAPLGVACGDTITADTTLTKNLNCSGDGLTIAALGVTVDLGGNTIRSNGSGSGIRVRFDASAVIQNGTIKGFKNGVSVDGRFGEAELDNLTLSENVNGLVAGESATVSISNSRIVRNSGSGSISDSRVTISDSVIKNNGGVGVASAGGAILINDDVSSNNGSGLEIHNGTGRYIGNRINHNGGYGIFTDLSTSTIEGNEINRNALDGIQIQENDAMFVPFYRIGDNTTNGNGDLGMVLFVFHGTPGGLVVDEGGNHARHNGNPLQCDVPGLTCTPR